MPFLSANIPSVLFWHFTDQFYHTDNDRLDKVSKETLKNVGVASLVSAFTLLNADENLAKKIIKQMEYAAIQRLNEELKQSKIALDQGEDLKTQKAILEAWEDWYVKAIETASDMVKDQSLIKAEIEASQQSIRARAKIIVAQISN